MIHEAKDSVSISAGRAAIIWEVRCKWDEEKTAWQWDYISCHPREIDIADVDMILWAAREPETSHKCDKTGVFMPKGFSYHVN